MMMEPEWLKATAVFAGDGLARICAACLFGFMEMDGFQGFNQE